MRIIKIKNNQDIQDAYCGVIIEAGEYYQIQNEQELDKFSKDEKVNQHLWDASSKIIINNGDSDLSVVDGDKWLKGNYVQEIIPRTPKNDHDLKPLGLIKKNIDSSNYVSDITLSNKSDTTYTYSNTTLTPKTYDCLTNSTGEIRDGIIVADTEENEITTFYGIHDNGTIKHIQPVVIDYELPQESTYYYIWGVMVKSLNNGDDDTIRLQVVDTYNVLGYGAGVVIKEYDEVWVQHINEITRIMTPDGAPAEIPASFTLRALYYAKDEAKEDVKVYFDYIVTVKD